MRRINYHLKYTFAAFLILTHAASTSSSKIPLAETKILNLKPFCSSGSSKSTVLTISKDPVPSLFRIMLNLSAPKPLFSSTYLWLNHISVTHLLREAKKKEKSCSLNGRAIKRGGEWGLGLNGPAIKRRTFFAASLNIIT